MGERVIRVTGKGQIKVKPDMTRITLTLENTREQYGETLEASAKDTETMKGLLEEQGFAPGDVKTLSFKIDMENKSYQDGNGSWKTRFVGYKYRHVMKVEFPSDNDRLGKILYLLANNGALRPEFRFSFFVKDAEASKNELLGKAVADAKAKAEVLATAADVRLKEIASIDYSWGEVNFEISPMERGMELMDCKMMASEEACSYDIDIEPDDIQVSDTVTVVWNIG